MLSLFNSSKKPSHGIAATFLQLDKSAKLRTCDLQFTYLATGYSAAILACIPFIDEFITTAPSYP